MRILHISDTHNLHKKLTNLPEADIIIHSGDFTFSGSEKEAFDFMNWFCDLPYPHKIFIAGNHDDCLDGAEALEGLPDDVHYLNNSGIEIEGVKIYGVPMFMSRVMSGEDLIDIAEIPSDVDILVTHQPPYGIFDFSEGIHYGSKPLLDKVHQLSPKAHLFGHIHDANGIKKDNGIVFANSAIVDSQYNLAYRPRLLEVYNL